MKNFFRKSAVVAALFIPLAAFADPVVTVIDQGENNGNGTADGYLGGYEMTAFADPVAPTSGCTGTGYGPNTYGVTSTPSPISGDVQFVGRDHVTPLCMSVYDPTTAESQLIGEDWWEWEDHGNVFTTSRSWVELILPANTRAFWLYVGAHSGRGWIEGQDAHGDRTLVEFGGNSDVDFGWGETPGFGVHTTDSCSSISRIVIEPWEWGTGSFAINQGACTQVPEPAPIWLLGLGLLGLVVSRKFRTGALPTR